MSDQEKPEVPGEEIELRGNPIRGLVLYETETGRLEFEPLKDLKPLTLDEVAMFAERLLRRVNAELVAATVLKQMATVLKAEKAAEGRKPTIFVPQFSGPRGDQG